MNFKSTKMVIIYSVALVLTLAVTLYFLLMPAYVTLGQANPENYSADDIIHVGENTDKTILDILKKIETKGKNEPNFDTIHREYISNSDGRHLMNYFSNDTLTLPMEGSQWRYVVEYNDNHYFIILRFGYEKHGFM